MEKVYSKINKHQMRAMQQMTKGTFDDRPMGEAEFQLTESDIHKNAYFKNLGRLQKWYLRVTDLLSIRNIIIGLCFFLLFVYTSLPFCKYAFLTIDRHYFGIVTEKLPPLV